MLAPSRRSLELIPNETARKMAFRKRKKSVYKKANELSKLCDIDVALVVYEADQKKGIRPVQPETWPQDPAEFNRILSRYKASKDAATPGFLRRSFSLSDFYEAKKKKDDDSDDGNGGDDSDGDDGNDNDDDHVDPKVQKRGNKQISKDKYPTWDAQIDLFSEDELIKLIASLEAKIQASTLEIHSMERYSAKQNQNFYRPHSRSSKIPEHLKPANFDVQKPPSHDPVNTFIHDALGKKVTHELAQWGGFNKNPVNTTTTTPITSVMQSKNPMNTSTTCTTTSNSAIQSKSSPSVKCPMLPSAWISISQSQKT
ncbi:hypothetical protein C1H46_029929 [Malus baccata]|uniref:MADS-box domain-containing protein n=1 Tax=Malus baccata TaxID=106549 RepID=A0A540LDD4_MALBA|nr:hypothetical protein C1H46_029929 [Malus baccata]